MKRIAAYLLVALAVVVGCGHERPAAAPRPLRIITFSPGLTSIVFGMGLGDQVIGVTDYCILPEGVERPRLGNRQTLTGEGILKLDPDVIFVQQNPQSMEDLRKFKPDLKIVPFEMERMSDIPAAMRKVGELTGRGDLAEKARGQFEDKLAQVQKQVAGLKRPRVIAVMGYDRPVVFAPGSFVGDMIEAAGGENVGATIEGATRYRTATLEGIIRAAPDVLFCQVDPSQEAAAREFWARVPQMPAGSRVIVVTDRLWGIPGPHLADLTGHLARMIHPELVAAATASASATASAPAAQGAKP